MSEYELPSGLASYDGTDHGEKVWILPAKRKDLESALKEAMQILSESTSYAGFLALHTWEYHYQKESPHWEVGEDVMTILTQLDNMLTGMARVTEDANEP